MKIKLKKLHAKGLHPQGCYNNYVHDSSKSLYAWIKTYYKPSKDRELESQQSTEIRRLKAELARVKEERDILKKATAYFARDVE